MSCKTLIDYLKEIPDWRNPRGRQHQLWLVLLIIIMGIMSGYNGYQGLGRFVERHRSNLIKLLKIPQARVPSYSTLRRVMMELDYQQLTQTFQSWAAQELNWGEGEWLAGDGKSLKNTVEHYDQAGQNFKMIVSLFTHHRGLVLGLEVMENGKESEITVMQRLLQILSLEGFVISLDALHCQKKR